MFISFGSTQTIDSMRIIPSNCSSEDQTSEGKISNIPVPRNKKFLLGKSRETSLAPNSAQLSLAKNTSNYNCKNRTDPFQSILSGELPKKIIIEPSSAQLTRKHSPKLKPARKSSTSKHNIITKNAENYENEVCDETSFEDVFIFKQTTTFRKTQLRKVTLPMKTNHINSSATGISFNVRLDDHTEPQCEVTVDSHSHTLNTSTVDPPIDTLINCEDILKQHGDLNNFIQSRKQPKLQFSNSSNRANNEKFR